MIRVREIDHVVLRVADIDRSLAFYRDVLGCSVERIVESLGLWQMRAGRAMIDLVPVSGRLGAEGGVPPGREGRNVDHVCLRIDPWDEPALRAHLAHHDVAAGATEARVGAEGAGPSIYIQDPDGNVVELKGPPA